MLLVGYFRVMICWYKYLSIILYPRHFSSIAPRGKYPIHIQNEQGILIPNQTYRLFLSTKCISVPAFILSGVFWFIKVGKSLKAMGESLDVTLGFMPSHSYH